MSDILIAVAVLGVIALVAAVVLYLVSKKFTVHEDPRIGKVQEVLPGANCGGCGFAGCSAMAEALVKGADKGSIDGLLCPVGGQAVMSQVADVLGMTVAQTEPKVAVVRCNGTCENRPRIAEYDGLSTCAAMNLTSMGNSGCGFGCLGCGDCTRACQFGAITMDADTGLPVVDEEKCTACDACVKACPRHIIELRKKGPKGRRVFVQCVNKDKGAVARKACKVACIGCGKCAKVCKFEAITVENNVAYIDPEKCRLCTKCVDECPTGALTKVNFPVRPARPAQSAAAGTAKPEAPSQPSAASAASPASASGAANPSSASVASSLSSPSEQPVIVEKEAKA
jgi:electron transport complex protein RnfB